MESVTSFFDWINLTVLVIFSGITLLFYWNSKVYSRKSTLNPRDETVLITGCDSGIGYQCAKLYDRLGFQVFAGCLFPDGSGAQQLIKESSSHLKIISLDITNETQVNQAFDIVNNHVKNKGRLLLVHLSFCSLIFLYCCEVTRIIISGLWGLLNNAGVLCYGEFEWYSWNQCLKQVSVNLLGTVRVVKTFLPLIKMRKGNFIYHIL